MGLFLLGGFGIEETTGQFWRWDAAGLRAAKPGVTIAGDPLIDGVAEEGRQWCRKDCQGPGEAQAAGNAQGGRGAGVDTFFVDQDHAVGERVERRKQLTGGLGLKRGEAEDLLRVSIDDPVDRPVAEVADAVEEDDGGLRHRLSQVYSASLPL